MGVQGGGGGLGEMARNYIRKANSDLEGNQRALSFSGEMYSVAETEVCSAFEWRIFGMSFKVGEGKRHESRLLRRGFPPVHSQTDTLPPCIMDDKVVFTCEAEYVCFLSVLCGLSRAVVSLDIGQVVGRFICMCSSRSSPSNLIRNQKKIDWIKSRCVSGAGGNLSGHSTRRVQFFPLAFAGAVIHFPF